MVEGVRKQINKHFETGLLFPSGSTAHLHTKLDRVRLPGTYMMHGWTVSAVLEHQPKPMPTLTIDAIVCRLFNPTQHPISPSTLLFPLQTIAQTPLVIRPHHIRQRRHHHGGPIPVS